MKIQRFLFPVFVLVILTNFFLNVNAQKTDYLPDYTKLSFNGKFFNDPVNDEFKVVSDNGLFKAKYEIGEVTDEMREIKSFRLFKNDILLYSLDYLPGSDLYISNSGYIAIMDMKFHFKQELTVHIYNSNGKFILSETFRYASLFGFSPKGKQFVVGTDKFLNIISLTDQKIYKLKSCSKFSFSADEKYLATAKEDQLNIYHNYELTGSLNTGLFYPRGIAISTENDFVSVIGKKELKTYSVSDTKEIFNKQLQENYSFRDIRIENGLILSGVHYRHNGISKGILKVYNSYGEKVVEEEHEVKSYETFENKSAKTKSTGSYETIPWPFVPFDEVHTVWNHYEQHMGDGSGSWSYLHQGLDIITPVDEPTYAVQEGWVKLVLTLGGAVYWRVAVSQEQVSGYSDGWLYAHLVESSIQVDVGDYVQLHDYLGDIIHWSADWGHIHFVEIHDQGEIWYYNDDEWGINFNPLLALDPITDDVPPVIENFSTNSKFGFCVNETSNYLSPDNLYGDIDIIVKISDYHGDSQWEQPAFKTYYWIKEISGDTIAFPKTLGQILNHQYSFYSGGNYEAYAPLMYKKDYNHPSPPWMNEQRDYFQILTNNNGDSIVDPSETQLAFPTADYPDGNYRIFVEAWDEFGNMVLDSLDVVFDNYTTNIEDHGSLSQSIKAICYPNPANGIFTIEYSIPQEYSGLVKISLLDSKLSTAKILSEEYVETGTKKHSFNSNNFSPGLYFYQIEISGQKIIGKLLIL